jgi:hypothetical protein
MKTFSDIGVQISQAYIPKPNIDLTKWAVIACDQFTSEPEYWHEVEEIVGDSVSTLKLILPEVYLKNKDKDERVKQIQSTMKKYLEDDLLQLHEGLIYVERTIRGKIRSGSEEDNNLIIRLSYQPHCHACSYKCCND